MHLDPIRTTDEYRNGLFTRYIHGLNIFALNNVSIPPEQDPLIAFISRICADYVPVVHIGGYAIHEIADSVDDILDASVVRVTTPWACSQGDYYYMPDSHPMSVILVNGMHPGTEMTCEHVLQLLGSDALALYLTVRKSDPEKPVSRIFADGSDPEEVYAQLVHSFDCVVHTEADGWWFKAVCRNKADFSILDDAIIDARNTILDSEWYQMNKNSLVWKDDPDFCLALK